MVWKNDVIVVWFSSGAASAVAAKKTIEKYKNIATIRIVNNPIKEEHSDNLRFLKDVEKWLGVEIEFAINDKYKECSAVDVWKKRKFMSGPSGAPCTTELKRNARSQWEQQNKFDWLVLGFT
jgi:tRNA U34 2-thiouridine synthase MnmA/TrmU